MINDVAKEKLKLADKRNDLITIQYLISSIISKQYYNILMWISLNNAYNVLYVIVNRFSEYDIFSEEAVYHMINNRNIKLLDLLCQHEICSNFINSNNELRIDVQKVLRVYKINNLLNV